MIADKIEADPSLLDIPLANIARWLANGHSAVQRLEGGHHVEHAAHADVVGDASVDEMKVRTLLAVGERLQLLEPLHRARGRPRRVVIVQEHPGPGRRLPDRR